MSSHYIELDEESVLGQLSDGTTVEVWAALEGEVVGDMQEASLNSCYIEKVALEINMGEGLILEVGKFSKLLEYMTKAEFDRIESKFEEILWTKAFDEINEDLSGGPEY